MPDHFDWLPLTISLRRVVKNTPGTYSYYASQPNRNAASQLATPGIDGTISFRYVASCDASQLNRSVYTWHRKLRCSVTIWLRRVARIGTRGIFHDASQE